MHLENYNSTDTIIIYDEGKVSLETKLSDETVWLSQKQMLELFDKNTKTISEHIRNVFDEGGLEKFSTVRKSRIVQKEGNRNVSGGI